jgi:ribosomal protein S18 acetylase RimI-like enzyme
MMTLMQRSRGRSSEPGIRGQALQLRPMTLERDRPLVIAFARDLFAISFGPTRFADQFGADGSGYIPWLAEKQLASPAYAALAVLAGEPAGMVVVGSWPEDPAVGYVYHYYLVPHARGRGLAAQLDAYAASRLMRAGYAEARLSVAETNEGAIRFYARQGWAPAGARADQPGILYMRRGLRFRSPPAEAEAHRGRRWPKLTAVAPHSDW